MSTLRSLAVSAEHPAGAILHRGEPNAVLRPEQLRDAEPLSRAIQESGAELRQYMLWAHQPQTPLEQLERIKLSYADYLVGRSLQMVLASPQNEILAIGGMERRVPLNQRGWEIGYWTPTPRAGRGYATLATKLLTLYAFDLLGADRVQVLIDESNVKSLRVAEKCGLLEEGRLANVTTEPPSEAVARGFRRAARCVLLALTPASYARQPWVAPLRRQLEVKNLLGHTITGFWS